MKATLINMTSTLKTLLIITCITAGFAGFTTCDAQAIVGKWNGMSVTNYFSNEYSKVVGKQMEEKTAKEAGASAVEYTSDHKFILTFSAINSPEVTTMRGTWSLNGDQLTLTLEPKYNPQKKTTTATISITGNTLTTTAVMLPPSRIIKSISTSTRI